MRSDGGSVLIGQIKFNDMSFTSKVGTLVAD